MSKQPRTSAYVWFVKKLSDLYFLCGNKALPERRYIGPACTFVKCIEHYLEILIDHEMVKLLKQWYCITYCQKVVDTQMKTIT